MRDAQEVIPAEKTVGGAGEIHGKAGSPWECVSTISIVNVDAAATQWRNR